MGYMDSDVGEGLDRLPLQRLETPSMPFTTSRPTVKSARFPLPHCAPRRHRARDVSGDQRT